MEDRVAPAHRAEERLAVEHVGHDRLDPRPRPGRRAPVERPHLVARRGERGDDVTADEPGGPGDERLHAAVRRRTPRAIRQPKRAIAEGIRSAPATTSSSAAAKRRISSSEITSAGSALTTFMP